MKRRFVAMLSVLALIIIAALAAAPISADSGKAPKTAAEKQQENVLEARFLNMLNHNFAYDSDFDCADDIVNSSVLALLDMRDEQNPEFIAEAYVKGYVKDMYGIELEDVSGLNPEFPHAEGYVYIIPRGFTKYNHRMVSILQNEDGSYTVTTEITSDAHDGEPTVSKAVSLIVPNGESSFGYNIIYSNILSDSSAI